MSWALSSRVSLSAALLGVAVEGCGGQAASPGRDAAAEPDAGPEASQDAAAILDAAVEAADALDEQDDAADDGSDGCVFLAPPDAATSCVYSSGGSQCCGDVPFQAPGLYCTTDGCNFAAAIMTTPQECLCGEAYSCECILTYAPVDCGLRGGPWCVGGGSDVVIIVCGEPSC